MSIMDNKNNNKAEKLPNFIEYEWCNQQDLTLSEFFFFAYFYFLSAAFYTLCSIDSSDY